MYFPSVIPLKSGFDVLNGVVVGCWEGDVLPEGHTAKNRGLTR